MKHLYANLLGNWVDLGTDPETKIFESTPALYIKEQLQDLFQFDYVNIYYNGQGYRVHPTCIQVVTTKD